MSTTAFDDVPDDLAALNAPAKASEAAKPVYVQPCPKCRGSGRYGGPSSYGSHCFKCGGKGTLTFKLSEDQRAKAREASVRSKEKSKRLKLEGWMAEHQEAMAIFAMYPNDSFLVDLHNSLLHWGSLTDGQLRAVLAKPEREAAYAAKKAEAVAAQAQRVAEAPVVEILKIETAFASAKASGLKKPRLHLGSFLFKPAKVGGKNDGAIYVTHEATDTYLGKIMSGKFIRVNGCSDEQQAKILSVCADPHGAAVDYGRLTGRCSCCSLPLTNKLSVELGIGPICRAKYGWGA